MKGRFLSPRMGHAKNHSGSTVTTIRETQPATKAKVELVTTDIKSGETSSETEKAAAPKKEKAAPKKATTKK